MPGDSLETEFLPLIRFENVGLRYGMGPEILRDVSFHLRPQSFQFLTGPSGAGKTTLCQHLLQDFRDQLILSVSTTTRIA